MPENNNRNSRWSQSGFDNRLSSVGGRSAHEGGRQSEERAHPVMPDYVRPLRNSMQHQPPSQHQSPSQNQPPSQRKSTSPHQTFSQAHSRQNKTEQAPLPTPAPSSFRNEGKGGLGSFLDRLNLKGFELDSDRALIIMMMAMLQKETFDETLMLALLYIML